MSDTREKLIREKVDLIDAIDYAMRDFDDYLDECNETCTPPIDKLEDFIADGVFSAGYRKKQEWIPVSEPPKEYRDKYGELIPFLVCERGTEYPFRGLYDGKTWGDGLISIYPTHWMPLPEPPKGE